MVIAGSWSLVAVVALTRYLTKKYVRIVCATHASICLYILLFSLEHMKYLSEII